MTPAEALAQARYHVAQALARLARLAAVGALAMAAGARCFPIPECPVGTRPVCVCTGLLSSSCYWVCNKEK